MVQCGDDITRLAAAFSLSLLLLVLLLMIPLLLVAAAAAARLLWWLQALCRDARCVPAGGASELEMARQVQQGPGVG